MKKFLYIPLIILATLLCSAKDINLSFTHYRIGIIMADTTAMSAAYEKGLYRQLRTAGHHVYKIDDSRLTEATWNTIENFSALDLVVIPNFVVSPSVDTSVVGGIGDVPIICLEDSLYDEFGFVGSSEPILYLADYGNFRIVQTKWDGTGWKSRSTSAYARKPYGISLGCSDAYTPDSTYVYFSSYLGGVDSLFRCTWTSTPTSYGTTGSGTGQFDDPRQVHVYDDTAATYNLLVGESVNCRLTDTKWNSSASWRTISKGSGTANNVYGVYKTPSYFFMYSRSKLYKGTSTAVGVTDSLTLANFGRQIYADDDYVIAPGGETTYKIYKISSSSFTKLDSLYGSKIGTPYSVWYDSRTGFVYWTDAAGIEIKRAKFDGTADGTEIDSCFASGAGVNQLSSTLYGGITGYVPSSLSIFTDDSIKVRINTDSVTSIYATTSKMRVYSANGSIAGIDTSGFTSANILCKSNDGTKATVVIDTLNGKKRIAFGLYDITKMSNYTNSGWTLFNRCIGRLMESEKDSTFSVGQMLYTSAPWPYTWANASFYSSDSAFKSYFETNMHRVTLFADSYGDSAQYRPYAFTSEGTLTDWATNQLYFLASVNVSGFTVGALIDSADVHSIPVYDLGNNSGITVLYSKEGNTINSILGYGSHSITTDAGISGTDTFYVYYNKTYPYLLTHNIGLDYSGYMTRTAVPAGWSGLLQQDIEGTTYYSIFANTTKFRVCEALGNTLPYDINFETTSDGFWDLQRAISVWLMEKSALFPPSGVTATPLSTSSIKISWTDNSSDELGFKLYLKNGGNYSGSDLLLSTLAAGVVADTISGFWGPNSQWYFDVGNWKAGTDTIQSGTPGECYTFAYPPPKPIVYALSDTSINIILNGYKHYDLFTDTTLATNPTWYRPYGTWNVEKSYNRLRTWGALDSFALKVTPDTQVLKLDGSTQYASLTETAGSLDNTLDMSTDDFMVSGMIYTKSLASVQRVIDKRGGGYGYGWEVYLDTNGKLNSQLVGLGTTKNLASSSTLLINKWYNFLTVFDKDGGIYTFLNGRYDNAVTTALLDSTTSNTENFFVGRLSTASGYFNGRISDFRVSRLGVDGLTTTGTYATSNLLIKVGSDTIYCQANSGEGLVKALYQAPLTSLVTLGYDALYDADRTEQVTNGTMEADANWSNYGTPTLNERSGVQKHAGSYSRHYTGNSDADGIAQNDTLVQGSSYEASFWVYVVSGTIKVAAIKPSSPYTNYGSTTETSTGSWINKRFIFEKASDGVDNCHIVVLQSGAGTSEAYIDDVSIRRIGEVAWWKFNETGIPTTLLDQTSNNLDLTTAGSPKSIEMGLNTISTKYDSSSKDIETSIKFHWSDSLRLNRQWFKWYFTSNDSLASDDGYYVYVDSSNFDVRKQTNNADVDTLKDSSWTGDYRWHTLKITSDWTEYPGTRSITWTIYLDGTSKGTFVDTTYQSISYQVLKTPFRRFWADNFYVKQTTPGANSTATQYCIQDSIGGKYLNLTTHEESVSADWHTLSEWGGESGTVWYISPFTSKKIRVQARNSN